MTGEGVGSLLRRNGSVPPAAAPTICCIHGGTASLKRFPTTPHAGRPAPSVWGSFRQMLTGFSILATMCTSGVPIGTTPVTMRFHRANPQGPLSGARRASRGGSWRHHIKVTRTAARSRIPPEFKYADYGLSRGTGRGGYAVAWMSVHVNGLGGFVVRAGDLHLLSGESGGLLLIVLAIYRLCSLVEETYLPPAFMQSGMQSCVVWASCLFIIISCEFALAQALSEISPLKLLSFCAAKPTPISIRPKASPVANFFIYNSPSKLNLPHDHMPATVGCQSQTGAALPTKSWPFLTTLDDTAGLQSLHPGPISNT